MSTVTESTTTPTVQSWSVWHIDPRHSLAEFSVRHMMLSKVRGRFTGVSGTIVDAAEDPKLSSVKAAISYASEGRSVALSPERKAPPKMLWVRCCSSRNRPFGLRLRRPLSPDHS